MKDGIIADLVSARQEIVGQARALPSARRDEVFLGIWSCKDLLAHLVGWDFANIDSVNDIRAGKPPRIFQHYDPEWASFNAQLVKQYKRDDWDEMLAAVQDSHHELIAFLQQIPVDDFARDFGVRSPGGRNITIAVHLQAEIDDERQHLAQIEQWLNPT